MGEYRVGFRDGFQGLPARAVSIGYDEQVEYLDGYARGKSHRRVVEKACKDEGIGMEELFVKAVDHYVESKK